MGVQPNKKNSFPNYTNFEVMISPLVKNIEKFEYWLKALPFYMNVQREGVVLSGAENI